MNESLAGKTSLQETCAQIDTILGTVDCDALGLASLISPILAQSCAEKNLSAVLRHFFESPDLFERAAKNGREIKLDPYVSKTAAENLKRKYADIVDSLLELALDEKPMEEKFYESITALLRNPIFTSEESRVFALYWLILDDRLPYFRLEEGLRMTNSDFIDLGRRLSGSRAKLRFILASEMDQRTERADLALRILDEHEGPERVRLMSFIIFDVARRATLVSEVSQGAQS